MTIVCLWQLSLLGRQFALSLVGKFIRLLVKSLVRSLVCSSVSSSMRWFVIALFFGCFSVSAFVLWLVNTLVFRLLFSQSVGQESMRSVRSFAS